MTAELIDGRKIASELEQSLKPRIEKLAEAGVKPCLAVIIAGENEASKIYVGKKEEACSRLGIESRKAELPGNVSEGEIIAEIEKLNSDASVHGILVQLPLPKGTDTTKVIESIAPEKDVDGFTSANMGKLAQGSEGLVSCTAKGAIRLIESTGKKFRGTRACVVGHGITVGMPLSLMLKNRGCTVSVCDKYTQNLGHETKQAEILVVCAGVPGLIKKEMVKEAAVVIDVGINRVQGKQCGDVAFDEVKEVAGYITPVPGGVGPMTVACLMENTVIAAEGSAGK